MIGISFGQNSRVFLVKNNIFAQIFIEFILILG
jgi:hypothetical protein